MRMQYHMLFDGDNQRTREPCCGLDLGTKQAMDELGMNGR